MLAWDSFAAYYWESSSTVISHDRLAEKRLARYQRSGRDDDWNILPAFELGFLIRQLPQQLNGAAFQPQPAASGGRRAASAKRTASEGGSPRAADECEAQQLRGGSPFTLSGMAGYDDGRVVCTDDSIILRRYSLWRARRIAYQAIREVRQVPLASLGMVRLQGSGDFVHWFNYDPRRRHKDRALVLHILADEKERSALRTPGDADERVKPVITPDDPDSVIAELIAHGVKVTSGPTDAD